MKDYIKLVEENFQEEVEFLRGLVAINSELGDEEKGPNGEVYPFGKGIQESLEYTLKGAEEMGFITYNDQNYGGHVDYGQGEKVMGILGHLDVVPAGEGWSFDPYSGAVADGWIYGRGTTDDKGPVVASLFAMKALKEAGYEPAAKIRLILGCDEETGWKGMDHYIEEVGPADYGFTPDGNFPVINGEKGVLTFDLVRKLAEKKQKGLELTKLEGGAAANMVPEKARAVIHSADQSAYEKIKDMVREYSDQHQEIKGITPIIQVRKVGTSLEIAVEGKSAHGAHPDLGLNAISILMEMLAKINFANEEVNDIIAFYNDRLGFDLGGERLGCDLEDEPSGHLTLNVGVVKYDKKSLTLTINIRYPVTMTEDQVYEGIIEVTDKYDLGIVKRNGHDPIFFPEDAPLVKTFMDVYQSFTGDLESKPLVIGGGTYARSMKNVIGFGAAFPDDLDLMHQRDERMELSKFMTMTKIFAEAIYKITQEDFEL